MEENSSKMKNASKDNQHCAELFEKLQGMRRVLIRNKKRIPGGYRSRNTGIKAGKESKFNQSSKVIASHGTDWSIEHVYCHNVGENFELFYLNSIVFE